jgi:hypothetical protein
VVLDQHQASTSTKGNQTSQDNQCFAQHEAACEGNDRFIALAWQRHCVPLLHLHAVWNHRLARIQWSHVLEVQDQSDARAGKLVGDK